MNENEIKEGLEEIRKNTRAFDAMLGYNFKTGKLELSEKQASLVEKLLDLFKALNWQLAFNSYKELKYKDGKTIRYGKGNLPGTPVKVCPCAERFGGKTYFGILVGDVATSISHSVDKDENLTASFSFYNPAIIIPELGEIVFGYESWWGAIKSKEELDKAITDETIRNVWYVKMLNAMGDKVEEAEAGNDEL